MTVLAGKRILVVEDEIVVAMMVEDMLMEMSAEVVGMAATISSALALAGSAQIDAAVLDVNVRGERIDPVAHLLRSRNIPVVFATGYGHGIAALAQGAPIVEKPYSKERLTGALETVLGNS
jgi:DNA-binding response OmpR family regulator